MDWDPALAEGPPPRHELESDEDEASPVQSVEVCIVPEHVEKGRPLVVLLGDAGAALLNSAHAPSAAWPATHTVQRAWVSLSGNSALLFVPRPDWLRSDACAPLAQAVLGALQPTSVAVVQAYTPSLYLTDVPPVDAPLRFLAHVPAGEKAPEAWTMAQRPMYAPWGVPNTVSGAAAAFYAEGVYERLPALLLSIPSYKLRPHANFQAPPLRWAVPYELQRITNDEAHARLATLTEPLDERYAEVLRALLPPQRPASGTTLGQIAAQFLLASKSTGDAGQVGDGGMYV